MAYDLFLGIIPKNWARGAPAAQAHPVASEPTATCTPEEKAKLEKLTVIKMKTQSGDKKAQKQWKAMLANIPSLRTKAKQGDPKARRILLILRQSGLLQRAQVFTDLSGNPTPIGPRKPWAESEPDIKVPPRKPWEDSEHGVRVGPRKAWADSDPIVKVPPRKPWESDETDKTIERAKKGDVSAQIALRKIAARETANREEMPMSGKIGSSHYIEIQGAFTGDERRARDEDSGCSSMGDSLSHNEYRALIMRQAVKSAPNGKPQTKDFFTAKSAVDKALGNAGVSIYIPGSKPERQTV